MGDLAPPNGRRPRTISRNLLKVNEDFCANQVRSSPFDAAADRIDTPRIPAVGQIFFAQMCNQVFTKEIKAT